MRARWSLVAMVLSLGVAYVAYPYVTLYRLGSAIQVADAATLESLVDWPAVREGIKEDVCDLVADEPGPATRRTITEDDHRVAPCSEAFLYELLGEGRRRDVARSGFGLQLLEYLGASEADRH